MSAPDPGRDRPWRHTDHPIRCAHCRAGIEACRGIHGDWMHTDTRTELCAGADTVARPETVDELMARANEERRDRAARQRAARNPRRGGAR